jgi:hypothetical protein
MIRYYSCCYLGPKEVELDLQIGTIVFAYLGPKQVELDLWIGTIVGVVSNFEHTNLVLLLDPF